MSAINNTQTNNTSFLPEISTCALGTTMSAGSGVALQLLDSELVDPLKLPRLVANFLDYSGRATILAGIVMSVYSMVHLCDKVISKRNELDKAVAATALGVLFTAIAETLYDHFWEIAPDFDWLEGHSMIYSIATNMGWQASAILGFTAVVCTGYAAYRLGQAILAD